MWFVAFNHDYSLGNIQCYLTYNNHIFQIRHYQIRSNCQYLIYGVCASKEFIWVQRVDTLDFTYVFVCDWIITPIQNIILTPIMSQPRSIFLPILAQYHMLQAISYCYRNRNTGVHVRIKLFLPENLNNNYYQIHDDSTTMYQMMKG